MNLHISTIFSKILIISIAICVLSLYGTPSKAYALGSDSLIEYENKMSTSWGDIKQVVKSVFKIIKMTISCLRELLTFRASEVSNTCIPYVIGPDVTSQCTTQKFHFSMAMVWAMISSLASASITVAAVLSFPLIGYAIAVGVFMYHYPVFAACLGAYSLSAAEFIMMNGQDDPSGGTLEPLHCTRSESTISIDPTVQTPYLTVQDVPFMYSCNQPNEGDMDSYKGYVGTESEYCAVTMRAQNARPKLTHKTLIMITDLWQLIIGKRSTCQVDKLVIGDPTLSAQGQYIEFGGPFGIKMKMRLYTYYTLMDNKVRLCSAISHKVLLPNPVLLGCTYVPPPVEKVQIDPYLKDIIQGTRCQYIMPDTHRSDLALVAETMIATNKNTNSVYLFLKSDWHVLSTVVGCFQDILQRVFIDAAYGPNNQPFLKTVQLGLRSIVFASLTLYISLLGIRIISGSQSPSRGEWVMFAIKFSVVLYVATGNIWLDKTQDPSKGEDGLGFYPAIMDTMQLIGSIFMDARQDNEPINMCFYPYEGRNLLGQHKFNIGDQSKQYTVQMTVWDYIDCVLVTYLNFNSCNFTTSGMILFWLVATSFWFGCSGILFAIFCMVYLIIILEVVFEFAHIMILSMFVVTILVLISPIIVCFYLFEITKEIAESWFLMLLGYMVYPGALFAFLALMLTTFDSVFYGPLNEVEAKKLYECSLTNSCAPIDDTTLRAICGPNPKRTSLYCTMLTAAKGNKSITNCGYNGGNFTSFWTERKKIPLLGTFTMVKRMTIVMFFEHIIVLMLFALLFHFMMGSIVEFIAQLFGVASLSAYAVGGQIGQKLGQLAVKGAVTAATGNASAGKAAADGVSSKSKNDEDKK